MFSKNHLVIRFFVFAFCGFTLVNLMFLNYLVLKDKRDVGAMNVVGSMEQSKKDTLCDTSKCVPALYNAIYQATASSNTSSTISPKTIQGSQEYYIALGTGTNSTGDWENVGGAAAYVDSGAYGNIQNVTFEASAVIPTGNETAYIRLFDVTSKHPVWYSDVSLQGGQPQFLISLPITLTPGNNLYQVQMKTQLQYPVTLTQSRIHIISK